jgi:hypothetical protein
MPGIAAVERGAAAGQAVLQQHRDANGGAFPETVAINLWWVGRAMGGWGRGGCVMCARASHLNEQRATCVCSVAAAGAVRMHSDSMQGDPQPMASTLPPPPPRLPRVQGP